MIDLKQLNDDDKGRPVIYAGKCEHRETELGTLSSWGDDLIFVKFRTDKQGQACEPGDLEFRYEQIKTSVICIKRIRDPNPDNEREGVWLFTRGRDNSRGAFFHGGRPDIEPDIQPPDWTANQLIDGWVDSFFEVDEIHAEQAIAIVERTWPEAAVQMREIFKRHPA